MGKEQLLPLFPLPVVLFPEATLPLHIFEERYRLMVGEAARDHSEFGVVLVQDGKLSNAGCTATVERTVRQYDDGRFDVETQGRRRFRTLSLDQTKPYLQGAVEFFDDEEKTAAPEAAQLARVVRLAQRIAGTLRSSVPDLSTPARPSFVIAHHLPLDLAVKQELLIKRSERERIAALAQHLEELSRRLETIERTQQVARTNGQAGRH